MKLCIFLSLILSIDSLTLKFYSFPTKHRDKYHGIKRVVCDPSFIQKMHKARGINTYNKESIRYLRVVDKAVLRAQYSYESDVSFMNYRPIINEHWNLSEKSLICKSLNPYADAYVEYKFNDNDNIEINIKIDSKYLPSYFKTKIETRIVDVFKKSIQDSGFHLEYLKDS